MDKRAVTTYSYRGCGREVWSFSHQVKCKSSGEPSIATRILQSWDTGSRVVLKADQEVATAEVQRQVVAMRSVETVQMKSSVGESQSNGRAVNELKTKQMLWFARRSVEQKRNTVQPRAKRWKNKLRPMGRRCRT